MSTSSTSPSVTPTSSSSIPTTTVKADKSTATTTSEHEQHDWRLFLTDMIAGGIAGM